METVRVTASSLRKDIYRLLDQVLETGLPLEIERKGKILRIVPQEPLDRLSKLPRREGFLVGAPDDLVHLDWSDEWKP